MESNLDAASIISKIQKLFALADHKSNSNKEEAEAAALKAQELIAKYNICMEAVQDPEAETLNYEYSGWEIKPKKWRYILSSIVADNFRCKCFWHGSHTVAFYGYTTDVKVAHQVYKFLFCMGDKLARKASREVRKEGFGAEGIYNTFVKGFLQGIKARFSEQCKALAIVTPQSVTDGYKEFSKDFKTLRNDFRVNYAEQEILAAGFKAGKAALDKRELNA